MRIQPGGFVGSMAGKFAGDIYSAPKGSSKGNIQIVRKYTKPINPNTVSQQLVRFHFSNLQYFYKNMNDASIGAQQITRADFLASIQVNTKLVSYRGIPTEGTSPGRQLWIGAGMRIRLVPAMTPIVDERRLPQDEPDEVGLMQVIVAVHLVYDEILLMIQRDRLGYV